MTVWPRFALIFAVNVPPVAVMKQPVVVSVVGEVTAVATADVETHTSFAGLPSGLTTPPRTVTRNVVGVGSGVGFAVGATVGCGVGARDGATVGDGAGVSVGDGTRAGALALGSGVDGGTGSLGARAAATLRPHFVIT